MALVVNLSYPVASSVSASALIMEKLGLSLPFSDGRDMVFQVNRRGALCSVPGCELNRLIKWTAETHQLITLNAGVPLTPTVISADVATLMVDVNTVPTGGRAFQTDQQIAIFEEMAAEVTRICAAGTPSLLV